MESQSRVKESKGNRWRCLDSECEKNLKRLFDPQTQTDRSHCASGSFRLCVRARLGLRLELDVKVKDTSKG